MLLTAEEIRRRLADRSITKVAEATGLTRAGIYIIMRGGNPSYKSLEALSNYLKEHP